MRPTLAVFALVASLASHCACADNSNWQDGVYIGPITNFFAGQSPAVINFVKAHSKSAADASIHLSPCPDDETKNLCNLNQTRFILDYIAAFYGDHNSQQNVASYLSGDDMPPKTIDMGNGQIGVNPDPVWGCAWRIAILTSGNPAVEDTDLAHYKIDCETLSHHDQDQAEAVSVSFLVNHIKTTMASGTIPYDLVDDYPGSP